ncbi:MAG: hypothetical protein ACAI44_37900 [Candidatus Sericytochromatia bacterium]
MVSRKIEIPGRPLMPTPPPDPAHHSPDAWQALTWVMQQGWMIVLGLVIWLINKLYTLLFDKRNAEVDQRLAAQDEKLDELIELVTNLRIEVAKLQGAPPPTRRSPK